MKNTAILAISSFALAHLVGAAPVNNKRDVVYTTTTEEVWETQWSTTTLWVDPTGAPSSDSPKSAFVGGFFEQHSSSGKPVNALAAPTSTSSVAASSPELKSVPTTSATTSSIVVPSAEIPTSSPTLPTSSPHVELPSTTAAPATTSAAPIPSPVAQIATSVPAVAVPSAAPVASSGGGGGTHTGDITYYDIEVGLTSCGLTGSNSQALVALSAADMKNGVNPNANPLCGKTINISYNGATHSATIYDTCPECASGSLDLTNSLFKAVAPNGDGRVHGVSWTFA